MRKTVVLTLVLLSLTVSGVSQYKKKSKAGTNPSIKKLLKGVSAKRLEKYNRKLVSFGTRNTN